MAQGRRFALVIVLNLLGNAFCLPADRLRPRRGAADNELDSGELQIGGSTTTADSVSEATSNVFNSSQSLDNSPTPSPEYIEKIFGINTEAASSTSTTTETALTSSTGSLPPVSEVYYDDDKKNSDTSSPSTSDDDDDEDDEFETMETSPSVGVGSNIFSLLSLLNGILGGSSGGTTTLIRKMMKQFVNQFLSGGFTFSPDELLFRRKRDVDNNEIETDLKPPPLSEETETEESNSSETSENDTDESLEDDDNGEESVENVVKSEDEIDDDDGDDNNRDDNDDDDDDDDDDEPPGGGDGEGGGILGLLAGLSGGEDGQSDLGSLLAAVSGIVANLSGDGIDVNALIASGIGLFVGLLSEGEENPGAVISSYLLTSLDTLSGGGSKNNGNFFGAFLSKLIKGISAAGDEEENSEENENGMGMKMADSSGFILSFLMGLLGDMSKGSSGGSGHPW